MLLGVDKFLQILTDPKYLHYNTCMKDNMKTDVIRIAISTMITDPKIDQKILIHNKHEQLRIIDFALHFEEMFYKHEVGNLVEFFEKMHNEEIHHIHYSQTLPTDTQNMYFRLIDKLLEVYNQKASDEKDLFPKRKTILQCTLNELKQLFKSLKDGMIENINYNEAILNKTYNDYLKIIANLEEKLNKSNKPVPEGFKRDSNSASTFLAYIKKAKMNYKLHLSDTKVVYPFVHDLLLYSFLIDARLNENSKSYIDRKDIFSTLKQVRKNLSYPSQDKRYIHIEYLKIAELLAHIEPEELHQYLLYHYSKILNCKYSHILSVFKQFKHAVTEHHRYEYRHEYEYKDFSFVPVVAPQDFRFLSLYVQLD